MIQTNKSPLSIRSVIGGGMLMAMWAALVMTAPSVTSVVCTGTDAAALQAGANTGGKVVTIGACGVASVINFGSNVDWEGNTPNGNVSGNAATTTDSITWKGSSATSRTNWMFSSNGINNTFNGLTISGAGIHMNGGSTTTCQNGWTITNNTFQNITTSSDVLTVDNCIGRGGNRTVISHNYFHNIWSGGYKALDPNRNTGCCFAVFINTGIDNLEFDWNYCNQVAGNCFKAFQQSFANKTTGFTGHNFDMSYNLLDEVARIGFEIQVMNSSCTSSFNCLGPTGDGFTMVGNYNRKQYFPIQNVFLFSNLQAWSHSLIAHNQGVMNLSGPCNVRPGIDFEISMQGGIFQSNVLGAPGMQSPCSPTQGFQTMLTYGYTSTGSVNTWQNNIYCQPNSGYKGQDPDENATNTFQFEKYIATCPTGTLSGASAFAINYTSANNQSFPSGGSGSWNIQLTSPLAIRWVDWAIDGKINTALRQTLSDVNNNFTATGQWLYHATFNTSTLTNGTHTITAIPTDVQMASPTSPASQTFTVGGSSSPAITVSPSSLTYTASGSQTVNVTNTGSATLNLTGRTITGSGASSFGQTSTCGSTLAPTASCTVTVTFSPSAGGTLAASLNIANNSSTNPAVVSLSGSTATLIFSQTTVPSGGTTYAVNSTYQAATQTANAWISLTSTSCSGEPVLAYGESTTSPFENYVLQLDSSCRPQFYFRSGTSGAGVGNILTASTALTVQGGTCTSSSNCTLVSETYDGTTVTLYINAKVVGQVSAGGTPIWYQAGLTSGLGVGRKFDIPFTFPGTISTVTEYLGAASQPFIQNIFNQGPAPTAATVTCIPANCVAQASGQVQLQSNIPVSWIVMAGSRGTLATAGPSTFNVYTAPSVIDEAHNSFGGCMVLPNDSVFNTPVSALPVNSNNTAWLAAIVSPNIGLTWSWDANVISSTTPPTSAAQFYYSFANNGPFQILKTFNRLRENGAIDNYFSGQDHHMVAINGQSCNFYETYQDRVLGAQSGACTPGSSVTGCTASSGYAYSSYSYAQPILASANGGTTDAAGLPLWPLTLTAQDIKNALAGTPIAHALRLTMSTGSIYNGAFLWPATNQNGGSVTTAPPMGARLRMKSSFSCSSLSTASQAVCAAEKSQGMFVADISGGGNQITVAPSVLSDPATRGVFAELASIPLTAYEFVDESSLQLSSALTIVNPANGHVTPSNSAIVVAGTTNVPIILDPVTIGTDLPRFTAIPGATYQPNIYINGTGTTTVTGTLANCSAGTGNCGTWTPSTDGTTGTYAPPSAVSPGTVLTTNLVLSPTVDTAVSTSVAISIMSAMCQANDLLLSTCVDSGASSSYGPDATGDTWSPDSLAPPVINIYNPINTPWPSGVVDRTLYETLLAPVGDIQYNFAVPNGAYRVLLWAGVGYDGGGGPLCNVAPSSYDTINRLGFSLYGNGVLGFSDWTPGYQMLPSLFGCFEPTFTQFPALVTNGLLNINLAALGSDAAGRAFNPYPTNLKIEADTNGPHFTINNTNVPVSNSTFAGSGAFTYYITSWYYTPATLTWSMTGPGSISTNADGTATYTPPGSLATSANAVISVTDGKVSAQTNLWVQGVTTPIH